MIFENAAGVVARRVGSWFDLTQVSAKPSRTELSIVLVLVAIGAGLRFWDLGGFSLHKPDEDTTVLAAMNILRDGVPQFPSGMVYMRAVLHSYLIAGSAWVFGESEWALRMPSALCGVVLVWLCWLLSRRFLAPAWRIAFAACVTFLPAAILDSQEARMYAFMTASLVGFLLAVFRWERTRAPVDAALAVLIMAVAVQFQELALLGALAILMPGLAQRDGRLLLHGMFALAAMGAVYIAISLWQGSYYPEAHPEYFPEYVDLLRTPPELDGTRFAVAVLIAAIATAVLVAFVARARNASVLTLIALAIGAGAALLLQAAYSYHLAALIWMATLIFAFRSRVASAGLITLCLAAAAGVAVYQLQTLTSSGVDLRKALGQLAGRPSVWTYLQLAKYSVGASVVVALGLMAALWSIAHGRKLADHWLFFGLAVWIPLLPLGWLAWFVPLRYVEFAMLPLLLTAFAVAQSVRWSRVSAPVAALALAIVAANPAATASAVRSGRTFADHKSAAAFLRPILQSGDLVIAEDSLMQAHYLGHIDYWLASPEVAAPFVIPGKGDWVDQYTSARLIDTVDDLRAAIASVGEAAVYIVGSVEGGGDRSYYRGQALDELLERGNLPVVYRGRDGTRIWKLSSGSLDVR